MTLDWDVPTNDKNRSMPSDYGTQLGAAKQGQGR